MKQQKIGLLFLASCLVAMAGCSSDTAQPVAAASLAQPEKSVSYPAAPAAEDFIGSGPLIVENQLDLSAQREGIVANILVDTGSVVRKGQILAKLDDRQLTADLEAAVALADASEADLKNWEATIKVSQVDLDRSEKMYAANLITEEQVEHDRYKVVANQFERDRQQKEVVRAANLAQSLRLELEKTRIQAPFDGIVARRYIRAGQRVTNGDKLFWITATSPLRVKCTLRSSFAWSIKKGSLLEVVPAEGPGESHKAKVILVSPVIDPASDTVEITGELMGDPGLLKPGMVTKIRLADKQ